MATLSERIVALANAVGTDVKSLRLAQGDLTQLTTTTKTNLVSAINELRTLIGSAGAQINDMAGDGDTTVTWSADRIYDAIELAKMAVKNEIVNGAAAALDTLNELAAALGNDPNFAATIAAEIANRVRYDAPQVLTNAQQMQARSNIAAAGSAEFSTFVAAVGNTDQDFVAGYNTAKA